jgi:hypothetical protein
VGYDPRALTGDPSTNLAETFSFYQALRSCLSWVIRVTFRCMGRQLHVFAPVLLYHVIVRGHQRSHLHKLISEFIPNLL